MAGHGGPKDGVAPLAHVPAIHTFFRLTKPKDVDAGHKSWPGLDPSLT
jgi:hypothetical protein